MEQIKHLIANKEFITKFATLAYSSYENYGSYEDMYMIYENELSDDEIWELLSYCEDNDLIDF